MAGRLTKRTPSAQETIVEALRNGNTRRAAFGAAGISHSTFAVWLEADPAFLEAVTRAEAQAEAAAVAALRKGFQDGDWRAAESWLKRARRADWGDSLDVRKLDDDTLLRLIALAAGDGEEGSAVPARDPCGEPGDRTAENEA